LQPLPSTGACSNRFAKFLAAAPYPHSGNFYRVRRDCGQPSERPSDDTHDDRGASPIGGSEAARGWVHAVDGATGSVLWKYHADAPVVADVTPTAGGLVFSADLNGNLFALDAKTGAERYKLNTGGAVAGGVITYETAGKQYVAITSGNVSRMTFTASAGSPKVMILTTGLAGTQHPRPEICKTIGIPLRILQPRFSESQLEINDSPTER